MLIRAMRRHELDVLVDWAATEGWNPGKSDADIFWATDPEGFIAAESDGELIGGGSIVSYGRKFGFMGFFIMRPDFRGRGLGNKLWNWRLQKLITRLDAPASIGMDGVFDMQSYYAKGGFVFAGRDLRFEGVGKLYEQSSSVIPLDEIAFTEIDDYDQQHFPAPRTDFLQLWISQPGAYAKARIRNGKLTGYAVARPCRQGYKIGPLFADDKAAADELFRALSNELPGQAVFLDVPENNDDAVALAKKYQMKEVFGCAKMYYGARPKLPEHQIFAVTSFELG